MGLKCMPHVDEQNDFIFMYWGNSVLNALKRNYYAESSRTFGADMRTLTNQCMCCYKDVPPNKNKFMFFKNGTIVCHDCAHMFAVANMKYATWADPDTGAIKKKPIISWTETEFITLAVDVDGVMQTVTLPGNYDLTLQVRIFRYDFDTDHWHDKDDNEQLIDRYEKKVRKWVLEEKLKFLLERDGTSRTDTQKAVDQIREKRKKVAPRFAAPEKIGGTWDRGSNVFRKPT